MDGTLILQFFYPSRCRACSVLVQPKEFLCPSCLSLVKPVVSLYLPITKKQVLKVYAAGAYQDPLRSLVLKKLGADILASKQLGAFMVKMIPFDVIPCDVLIPVPLHWTRYASRGYNQAVEMAKVIGKAVDAPVLPLLARHKRTVFQSRLTSDERQHNVADAFDVSWRYYWSNKQFLQGKNIVIVDDLYTTGATVKSMARALLAFQPQSITAVVACRAL